MAGCYFWAGCPYLTQKCCIAKEGWQNSPNLTQWQVVFTILMCHLVVEREKINNKDVCPFPMSACRENSLLLTLYCLFLRTRGRTPLLISTLFTGGGAAAEVETPRKEISRLSSRTRRTMFPDIDVENFSLLPIQFRKCCVNVSMI